MTGQELREALNYNPQTGVFTWLKLKAHNKTKNGDVAGTYCGRYLRIKINYEAHYAHCLAWLYMTDVWPKDQIDHINHIRDDNRFVNLREATSQENNRNASLRKDNTSGVTGVKWYKRYGKWNAQIRINGKDKNLGYFDDKFEAICIRLSANNKHGYHPNHGATA